MSAYLDVARTLAIQASHRLMELRQVPLVKERKADRSWVTNADHESDEIIRTGLAKAFPGHSILTEESGLLGPADAEYLWVIDPLDGTKAYINNTPGYSVMIGLLKAGVPFAGVVMDPVEGHLYEAEQGGGAWWSQTKVHVSDRQDWKLMPVITSTGFPEKIQKQLAQTFTGMWLPPVNSVGIKVGLVVRQLADIYINHHSVHYWDTCAPQVILEEAGGTITQLNGSSLSYTMNGTYRHAQATLATNSIRHVEALSIVRSAMPPLG